MAGPIERSKSLLEQINSVHTLKLWDYGRISKGLILMLWGYFQKMVIADRLAILVDTVYDEYWLYGSTALLLATFLFAIQIYCDFASYSNIAVGAAQVMGFTLMENFDTPYLSKSIKEFWGRWHISLSTWFRDYLYIPLGGNRKGTARKYLNKMIVFLASGLWHGADWTFVVWGGIHGMYQVIGEATSKFRQGLLTKLHVKTESFSYGFGQMVITFFLTDFAWIFFRAGSLRSALEIIRRIAARIDIWTLFDQSIYTWGLDQKEFNVMIFGLVVLLLVDLAKKKSRKRIDEFLAEQCLWFRWGILMVLLFSCAVFGVYGVGYDAGQFIYFQF